METATTVGRIRVNCFYMLLQYFGSGREGIQEHFTVSQTARQCRLVSAICF